MEWYCGPDAWVNLHFVWLFDKGPKNIRNSNWSVAGYNRGPTIIPEKLLKKTFFYFEIIIKTKKFFETRSH